MSSVEYLTRTEHQGGSVGCVRDYKDLAFASDYPIDICASAGVGVYANFGISAGKHASVGCGIDASSTCRPTGQQP